MKIRAETLPIIKWHQQRILKEQGRLDPPTLSEAILIGLIDLKMRIEVENGSYKTGKDGVDGTPAS